MADGADKREQAEGARRQPPPETRPKPKAPKPVVEGAPVVERKQPASTQGAAGGVTPSPTAQNAAPKPTAGKVKFNVRAVHAVNAEDREADKKSLGQARKSLIFLAAVTVAYLLFLIISGQMDEFVRSLGEVNSDWIWRGALCYLAYYVLGVSAYIFSVAADPTSPVGVRDLMSVEASGIFFMNLTPNGVGAAPAQIYRLTRSGLTVGGASALQSTRFIIYEAGEGIFAALMLIFRLDYFIETFGNIYLIGVILFGLKILECVALMIICLYPKFVIKVSDAVMKFLHRRGWLKDFDRWHNSISTQVTEFANGFRTASKNIPEMITILILTLLQLGCLYALPWFVLKAFDKPADLITCLASGSMLELLTSAIPLPGGTGGAESGFAVLFGDMFGDQIAAGYVLWRAIEYFLPTLCAAPLLGLRSKSGESINHRWHRFTARLSQRFGHKSSVTSGGVGGTIKVKVKRRH